MTEVKSGYIHKCGNTVKSWKRRWFVLKTNGYLYYYEDKSSTTEKGKIDVVDASKVGEWKEISSVNRKLPSGFSSSNAFGIVVRDRTFTCVCENEGDAQSWIATITKVRNADIGGKQQYPEATYPQAEELPIKPKIEAPLMAPPPYSGSSLPRNSHVSIPPPDTTIPHTLPRPKAKSVSVPRAQAPPSSAAAEMPPLPSSNPYYTPEVKNKLLSAPPQYQPQMQQPQYRAPPPQYSPSPQPQYRPPPQPRYRPPPQPQYRPPPQQQYRPQYQLPPQQYRPPPQPQYQPQYRPAPQAYCPPVRGPYPSYPQGPPAVRTVRNTNVTVVNISAQQQQVVYRR